MAEGQPRASDLAQHIHPPIRVSSGEAQSCMYVMEKGGPFRNKGLPAGDEMRKKEIELWRHLTVKKEDPQ